MCTIVNDCCIQSCTIVYKYVQLYTIVYNCCLQLYTIVYNSIQFYTYNCIQLFYCIQLYTALGVFNCVFSIQGRKGRRKGQIEFLELPNGWQVNYKVRKTGSSKGERDRFLVTPDGKFLRSNSEMEAHLYLESLSKRQAVPRLVFSW